MTQPTSADVPEATDSPADAIQPDARPDRMLVMIGIFTGIVSLTSLFTGATWRYATGATSLAWLFVPAALALSFVPAMPLGFRRRNFALSVLYKIGAAALAFLNYFFLAALATWVAIFLAALVRDDIPAFFLASLLYGFAAATALYGFINAATLRTTRLALTLPGLPESWKGRTLALVTDVHVGNVRGAGFVRRIVARLQTLKPDAVLIAGDMFDGAAVDLEATTRPWRNLPVPRGIYFSTGNHDEFSDRTKYLRALSRTGVRVLNNEKITVDGLQIIGVHDGEAGEPALFREILREAQIDRRTASILLTHQPAHLDIPEQAGISLQVSGHTHGGQFWPWTHVVSKVHGRFAYGLNRLGNLLVYTSSGAGTWGPPVRVGTRSEVVMITLA